MLKLFAACDALDADCQTIFDNLVVPFELVPANWHLEVAIIREIASIVLQVKEACEEIVLPRTFL